MSPPSEGRWLAGHLFFPGGIYTGAGDRVALEVVEPFVRRCQREGWADGWFFIRYTEHGPHLRLRLHGAPETLEGTVWPALEAHLRAQSPELVLGLPDPPPAPFPQDQPGGEGRVTHLARVEYEPETERYGGPQGVRLAERFFQVSSEAALALVARTQPTERSSRLGKGLLSMVVLIHVFCPEREAGARFANGYGINYLHSLVRDEAQRTAWLGAFGSGYDGQAAKLGEYVDEVWERMSEGDELSEVLDAYHAGLRGVRDEFRALFDAGHLSRGEQRYESWGAAVSGIVSSYLHMMNNRLGITIQEESYLAYLIFRALGKEEEVLSPGS